MSRKNIFTSLLALVAFLVITPSVFANPTDIVEKKEQFDTLNQLEEFWTKEKMENAIPMDIPLIHENNVSENHSEVSEAIKKSVSNGETYDTKPSLPKSNNLLASEPDNPYLSTTGKLFSVHPESGAIYSCSASAVNSQNKNLVVTAAHCIHDGNGGEFYNNSLFVPAYRDGNMPYGFYPVLNAATFNGWYENGNSDFDQAILAVGTNNGNELVDVM